MLMMFKNGVMAQRKVKIDIAKEEKSLSKIIVFGFWK
jgi:hypothetical protein